MMMIVPVFVGVPVMMMIVLVVHVLYARRHRDRGFRLRVKQPAEQEHEQRAGQRE